MLYITSQSHSNEYFLNKFVVEFLILTNLKERNSSQVNHNQVNLKEVIALSKETMKIIILNCKLFTPKVCNILKK